MACNSGFQTRFPAASPEAESMVERKSARGLRQQGGQRRLKELGARPSTQIQLGNLVLSDYRFYFEVLHTILFSKELPILHFFNS